MKKNLVAFRLPPDVVAKVDGDVSSGAFRDRTAVVTSILRKHYKIKIIQPAAARVRELSPNTPPTGAANPLDNMPEASVHPGGNSSIPCEPAAPSGSPDHPAKSSKKKSRRSVENGSTKR